MKTTKLTQETIDSLKAEYGNNFFEAMTEEKTADAVLSFIERAAGQGIELGYAEAFFAPRGIRIMRKGAETRLFVNKDGLAAEIVPLRAKDAAGDWRQWLKGAETEGEIEGWR